MFDDLFSTAGNLDSYDPPAVVAGDGVLDTLSKIGGAIGGVATSVYQFQAARDNQQFQSKQLELQNQLALTKARGAVDVEKYRAATDAAVQRAKLTAAAGLDRFYSGFGLAPGGAGGGTNVVMLAVAAFAGYMIFRVAK